MESMIKKTMHQVIKSFMDRYSSDEEYREKLIAEYTQVPTPLSLLEIYLFENYIKDSKFNRNLIRKVFDDMNYKMDDLAMVIGFQFAILYHDDNFRQAILEKYSEYPESFSPMETILILDAEDFRKQERLLQEHFDEYFQIDTSTLESTEETLLNFRIGQCVHALLDAPSLEQMRKRQKKSGMISTSDKPTMLILLADMLGGKEEVTKRWLERAKQDYAEAVSLNIDYFELEDLYECRTNITYQEVASYMQPIQNKMMKIGE